MEQGQLNFLRNNSDLIVRSTVYSEQLLELFLEEGILSNWDKQIIGSKKTALGKVNEFYRLILTKPNAYPVLLQALVETGQDELSKTLEENAPLTPQDAQLRQRIILRKFFHRGEGEGDESQSGRRENKRARLVDHQEEGDEAGGGGESKRARLDLVTQQGNPAGGGEPEVILLSDDDEMGDGNQRRASVIVRLDEAIASASSGQCPPNRDQAEKANVSSSELPGGQGQQADQEVEDKTGLENILGECFKKLELGPTTLKVGDVPRTRSDMESISSSGNEINLPYAGSSDHSFLEQAGTRATLEFGGRSPFDRIQAVLKIRQFLDAVRASSTLPVRKFGITGRFLFTPGNLPLLQDFFRLCGPQTESIYFSVNSSPVTVNFDVRSLPPALDLGLLTKLEFQLVDPGDIAGYDENCRSHGMASFIEVVFAATRSLREFRFDFKLLAKSEFKLHQLVSVPIRHFEDIITKRLPVTVTVLILNMPVSDLTFHNLAESGLKLEEFQFHTYSTLNPGPIRRFLECQAGSLQIFEAYQHGPEGRGTLIDFPRMEKLAHLELRRVKVQLSFEDKFPMLSRLNFSSSEYGQSFMEFLELQDTLKSGSPPSSATTLHLPGAFPMVPMVKGVAASFPNITELLVSPCPDIGGTLEEVFVHFCNLERLFITFPTPGEEGRLVVDCLLAGICMDDLERIYRLGNWDDGNIELGKWQRGESILNMTKLKKLSLATTKLPVARVTISDFSAHFLFLQMISLEELCLDGFWEGDISPTYLHRLQSKLSLKIN